MSDAALDSAYIPDLHDVLAAIGHPQRVAILDQLLTDRRAGGSGQGITAIADAIGRDRFSTSRHLQVLIDAGLVTRQRRNNTRLNVLRIEPLHAVEDWTFHFTEG